MNSNISYFNSAITEIGNRPSAVLCHGFLQPDFGVGRPIVSWQKSESIAWVEDGNIVIMRDPSVRDRIMWSTDEFYAAFQPVFVVRYPAASVSGIERTMGSAGPWDMRLSDGELIDGVWKKTGNVSGGEGSRRLALKSSLAKKKIDRRKGKRSPQKSVFGGVKMRGKRVHDRSRGSGRVKPSRH